METVNNLDIVRDMLRRAIGVRERAMAHYGAEHPNHKHWAVEAHQLQKAINVLKGSK